MSDSAFRGRESELAQWLTGLIEADVQPAPGVTITGLRGMALNTAPGQYWVISSDAPIARELQSGVSPAAGTATPLSHGYVRLAVCGSGWCDLLSKGISVDLHPDVLRLGDFVQTGLHHIELLLQRTGENRVELYVPRSFAVSIWEWLTDAALPLGYDLRQEEARRLVDPPMRKRE